MLPKSIFHRKDTKPRGRMTWSAKESQSLSLASLAQGICRPNSHKCKYGSYAQVLFIKIDLITTVLQCGHSRQPRKLKLCKAFEQALWITE